MAKNRIKKAIGKLHLWLGLSSGLVVFIVSLTGCLYVFQEEICLLFQSGVFRNIEPQNEIFISPLEMKEKVEQGFEKEITYMNVTVFAAGDRASIVWVRDKDRQYTAFLLNPYSGQIIDRIPYRVTFWAVVLSLHTSLLIPEYGHHIVAISTFIFVFMLISGLILWFPKSKKGYKQRFKIKWMASPKRLNYDLHNVLGFYMTWLVIFIAISGLVWSYSWVDKGIYWIASGGDIPAVEKSVTSNAQSMQLVNEDKIDNALLGTIQQFNDLSQYYLIYPSGSTSCYSITLNSNQGSFFNRNDKYFIDQYSGEIVESSLWQDKNNGDKLQEANYNIHVGAILGLPGKVLAFLASLVATSLPITGFLIWLGRKKKKKWS